jgi:6-phosphogluconolactonase
VTSAAVATAIRADVRVYVGTRAQQKNHIHFLRLDPKVGTLSEGGPPTEDVNPSYLALHPTGRFLYAVNEVGRHIADEASVSAYAIDTASGSLWFLNRERIRGGAPCYLSLDREARYLLVANYWGGSMAVLPILADGRIGPVSSFVQHSGGATAPGRDPGPHVHSVQLDPENRFALVADLGRDELLVYRFDESRGSLGRHDPPGFKFPAGSGPRHFVFHPDGRHVSVINELLSTVVVLSYDPERGTLSHLQSVSSLPDGFAGANAAAEVAVDRAGRYLYASNRGHDSIAIFEIHVDSRLRLLGHQPAFGRTPRHFAIDSTGAYLVVANQDSDTLVVFAIDAASGALVPTGISYRVASPVFVAMDSGRQTGESHTTYAEYASPERVER